MNIQNLKNQKVKLDQVEELLMQAANILGNEFSEKGLNNELMSDFKELEKHLDLLNDSFSSFVENIDMFIEDEEEALEAKMDEKENIYAVYDRSTLKIKNHGYSKEEALAHIENCHRGENFAMARKENGKWYSCAYNEEVYI